jgi:hypothetical protein
MKFKYLFCVVGLFLSMSADSSCVISSRISGYIINDFLRFRMMDLLPTKIDEKDNAYTIALKIANEKRQTILVRHLNAINLDSNSFSIDSTIIQYICRHVAFGKRLPNKLKITGNFFIDYFKSQNPNFDDILKNFAIDEKNEENSISDSANEVMIYHIVESIILEFGLCKSSKVFREIMPFARFCKTFEIDIQKYKEDYIAHQNYVPDGPYEYDYF